MPRRIGYWLAFGAAAAGLVWAGWRGAPDHLATLINRTDVIVTVVLLAGLPWATRKVFGPVRGSRRPGPPGSPVTRQCWPWRW